MVHPAAWTRTLQNSALSPAETFSKWRQKHEEKKMWTNVYSPDWYQNLTVKTSTTSLALPWKCAPGGLGRASLAKNWIPSPTQPPAHEGQEATCPLIDTCWPESPSADPCCDDVESFPWLSKREWFVNLKRSRNCQKEHAQRSFAPWPVPRQKAAALPKCDAKDRVLYLLPSSSEFGFLSATLTPCLSQSWRILLKCIDYVKRFCN